MERIKSTNRGRFFFTSFVAVILIVDGFYFASTIGAWEGFEGWEGVTCVSHTQATLNKLALEAQVRTCSGHYYESIPHI